MKQTVSVEVEKATYDVGQAIGGLVASAKAHLAAGVTVANVVALVSENVTQIVQAVSEASQIGADEKDSPEAFGNALGLGIGKSLAAFLPKPTVAASTPAPAAPSA